MRILHVSDVYFPRVNGVSTSIQTFRRELARLGHETTLVAPAYPAPHEDDARTVRVPSRSIPLDPEDRAMHWRSLSRLDRRLADERFDLVHVQTPFLAHYAGVRLARRRGVPVVATYHTLFEEYLFHYVPLVPRGVMRALARRISRGQCDALDAVIVPSTAMRETLERYGVRARIEIVPTGIPLAEVSGGDGMRFRAARGIAPSRPVLLYVGRVAFEKNIGLPAAGAGARPPRGSRRPARGVRRRAGAREADAARARARARGGGPVRGIPRTHDANCSTATGRRTRSSSRRGRRRRASSCSKRWRSACRSYRPRSWALATSSGRSAARSWLPTTRRDFAAKVVRLLRDRDLRARLSAEGREYARTWSATALALRMEAFYRSVLDRAAEPRFTSPKPA